MDLSPLTAISPVDGRYWKSCEPLAEYLSEFALIKYRLKVEIEYFIALCEIPLPALKSFPKEKFDDLRNIYQTFQLENAREIKDIETVTNHDVKAVEYYIKRKMDEMNLSHWKEYVHFGLTSQDINNTAIPMSVKDAVEHVYIPAVIQLIDDIESKQNLWKDVAMLARTHGQPASPTRLGKELGVFSYRLKVQLQTLKSTRITGKFGGATGNFNAHNVAFPHIDWKNFANDFLSTKLGIQREETTTQISNYDNLSALFDALKRIDTIILDLDRDIWMYISMNYFRQKIKEGEVGSSAMPHKVNPIDFENSEGNLGISRALYSHLSEKLPVSRLQRDLTDSTVLRNIGVPMAHSLLGIKSTLKGMGKIILNEKVLQDDLENNWSVVAEAIQTILRREGFQNPYETLKALTRGKEKVNATVIKEFIASLNVSPEIKEELLNLSPSTYTGV